MSSNGDILYPLYTSKLQDRLLKGKSLRKDSGQARKNTDDPFVKKTKNLAPAWGVKHYLPGPYSIAFNPQVFSSISKAFS